MPIDSKTYQKGRVRRENPLAELLAKEFKAHNDVLAFAKDILEIELWPKQKEILRKFYDPTKNYQELVLCAGMRCVDKDSLVMTPDGEVPIKRFRGKVETGKGAHDAIRIGPEWRWCIEIKTEHTSLIASADHKVLTPDGFVRVGQLSENAKIATDGGYDTLIEKTNAGLRECYDLHVPAVEQYIVNGLITHNSSKTFLASIISTYELYKLLQLQDVHRYFGLPKGQEIFLINVATSERQARDTVFAHTQARIENSEWFQTQNFKPLYNEYRFKTGKSRSGDIVIRSEHSNSSSLVGKSALLVIFDELARFVDTKGKSSAEAVYDSLSRATKTFGRYGKVVSISSPMYVDDYIMKLLRLAKRPELRHRMLAFQLATWEINPNITREDLDADFIKNPEAAMRDFGAVPSLSIETFFKEDWKIDLCRNETIGNPLIESNGNLYLRDDWTPRQDFDYYFAGDPAYKGDGFGVALGHKDDNGVKIIDFAGRFLPQRKEGRLEIDVLNVSQFIIDTITRAPVKKVTFDTWNYPETVKKIRLHGVEVEQHTVKKKDYDVLKEHIYSEPPLINWYPNEVLEEELKSLEAFSNNRIDHPRNGSKDVSDAVANCLRLMMESENEIAEPPVWFVSKRA